METFVVRLFVAADVEGARGVLEDPLTGGRSSFATLEELAFQLREAIAHRSPVFAAVPPRGSKPRSQARGQARLRNP